jgi:hypothetical protein
LEDWCEDQRKMECCEGWQTKLRNVGSWWEGIVVVIFHSGSS